ncbi:MAG: hypothetical protein EHM72_10885 [Calditrichaeota bacterium]|nr:MAG: hypothetical protein EHM72_10885 [Calditrichota bacterium]
MKKYYPVLLFPVLLSLIFSCARKAKEPEPAVLARVGDRLITLDEFIRRAEYTIRPTYLRGDQYVHKKMILNSLLAEKMVALEAGTDNPLYQSREFQNYIQGRKEQMMRKYLYNAEGFDKVKLEDAQVRKAYRWAGREYDVAYFSLPNKSEADSVQKLLNDPRNSFEDVYAKIGGTDAVPTRQVVWQREGNDAIIEALYSDTLRVGQVIGPIQTDEKLYTAIKILGWNESIAITDEQIRLRMNDVKERLNRREAEKIYEKYVLKVMKGKTVQFEAKAFYRLADAIKPLYIIPEEEKQKQFNTKLWGEESQNVTPKPITNEFEEIKDWPLLTIAGDVWTVERLRDEMSRHPLVFRKKRVNDNNFNEQFKLAVVDLIRDKYLTEESYKRNYDRLPSIKRYADMWQDHAVALFHEQQVLRSQGCTYNIYKEPAKTLEQYLNPYVDSLQVKYSDQVEIDMKMFEDVKLTRIDMFVIEQNVPYPIAVPSFPVITSDVRLDYGQDMSKNK